MNFDVCRICGKIVTEAKHYWTSHGISIENYHLKYWPKRDLQTNEPLVFKSPEQYLYDDFNNKENLRAYLGSLTDDAARAYIINLLKKRKQLKQLVYLPSQFELRSILIPPISYLISRFGATNFNSLISTTDLINRFDYSSKLTYKHNPALTILIDTREQNNWKFHNINIEVQKLDVGDYAPKDNPRNVFIERKGLSDYCSTLSKGFLRFAKELERAKAKNAYLIIAVESKYQNLLNYNDLPYMHHVQATPNYTMHHAREISITYPNTCQFVAVDGRVKARELVEKIFSLENDVRKTDWQWIIDTNSL